MRIIIAGDGKVGMTLTRQLSAEGYNLTLIDSKQRVLDASVDQYDVMAICGNCASMDVLEAANVKDADLLIAATSMDEVNLLCCLTAHNMNPNLHTIARIRNPEYNNQIYKMRNTFALSMFVNPEKQAADEIERIIKFPGFLKRDTFAKGRVQIVELKVHADSKLCNKSLTELNNLVNCHFLVCCVLRNGETIVPGGDFVLKVGDHIFVTAPTKELELLLRELQIYTKKVKSVLICGGGTLCYYLAKSLLSSKIDVRIVESNLERCKLLADKLPDATIIHGDASSESLLREEGLEQSDALVTLTGLDEMNVIISLYGTNCGVPQIITKLGHMDHVKILSDLPIGSTIYPKHLCCANIVRYVRALRNQSGAALSVHHIANGAAEAVEFVVDANTRHCGIPLKDIPLKKHTLITCIHRNQTTIIPKGDTVLQPGDLVVVVSNGTNVIYQLNDIFKH